jgi:hypothetical protein
MELSLILGVLGWIAWVGTAYLAVSFAYGCRQHADKGLRVGVQRTTDSMELRDLIEVQAAVMSEVQAFFCFAVAVVFLVSPLNKLHLFWLVPAGYFVAPMLLRTPIVSPLLLLGTRAFLALVLKGGKKGGAGV